MIKLGIYKHYKGNIYEVIGIGKHSENLEELVVYRSIKNENEIWLRPISMWNEEVTLADGSSVLRFTLIEEK